MPSIPLFQQLAYTFIHTCNSIIPVLYEGPGQKYGDYSAFGQITGLCPCKLQAPSGIRLAGQRALQGVITIFIVGLSVHVLF
jgi:hypothetical protein